MSKTDRITETENRNGVARAGGRGEGELVFIV